MHPLMMAKRMRHTDRLSKRSQRRTFQPRLDPLEDRWLPSSGPIALWHADGNASDSAGAHNGALINGTTFADGKFGQAFSFDEIDDYVQAPDSPSWAFGNNEFSIACWVNVRDNQAHGFVANDEGSGMNNKWIFWYHNGNLELAINDTVHSIFLGANVDPFLTINQWHHVAVTRSGSTFTFYFDGSGIGTATSDATVPDANAPLTIGKGDGATNIEQHDFMGGQIDEVGIYDRALSAQEIQNLFGVYNLADDWSDAANPNGVWTYEEKPGQAITSHLDNYFTGQAAWAHVPLGSPGHIPAFLKSVLPLNADLPVGHVYVHNNDGANSFDGLASFPAAIAWTAPQAGSITISGDLFEGSVNRAEDWGLYKNGVLLTGGVLTYGSGSAANPFLFSSGSGGLAVLTQTVAAGDVIELQLQVHQGEAFGTFMGVDMSVALTPANVPPTLAFSAATYDVDEPDPLALITVTRTGDASVPVSVHYATSNGTALAGADYEATSGTLDFAAGQTSRILAVPIFNDAFIEADETVQLQLTSPTNGAILGDQDTATLTIVNDDLPKVSFKYLSSRVDEAGPVLRVEAVLSESSPVFIPVQVAVMSGTATEGSDFQVTHLIGFPPGVTRSYVFLQPLEDSTEEVDESVRLVIQNPQHAKLGSQIQHTVTILDNDGQPTQTKIPDHAGDTPATARFVDLFSVPRQILLDGLQSSDVDYFAADLRAGDFLAIDVDPLTVQIGSHAYPGVASSTLQVIQPDGTTLITVGRSREPDTGSFTDNPAYGFIAAHTGTYYFKITDASSAPRAYSLELHRIGLAEGPQDPRTLQQKGGMYAALVGDRLLIRGPTGYGFAIRGNWKESTLPMSNSRVSATYTASSDRGPYFLETAAGEIRLADLGAGRPFKITTKGNVWGTTFGEVSSVVNGLGIAYNNVLQEIAQAFGADVNSLPLSQDWTLKLGSDLKADPKLGVAQALEGVPYLMYAKKSGFNADFGATHIEENGALLATVIAADPSDPMLYLSIKLGLGVSTLAFSLNGMLPYVPEVTPSPDVPVTLTNFFGHVSATGGFVIPKEADGVNLGIVGSVTASLDADGDGEWLGGRGNASQLYHGDLFDEQNLLNVIKDLALGANGQVEVGYANGGFDFSMHVGRTSVVLNEQEGLWFKSAPGISASNVWSDTPFDSLTVGANAFLEGSYSGGNLLITVGSRFDVAVGHLLATVTLNNTGVTIVLSGAAQWQVRVSGVGQATAKATFTATLSALYDGSPKYLHYVGTVQATGKVGHLFSGSIDARVDSDEILFPFPLGIGDLALPLP